MKAIKDSKGIHTLASLGNVYDGQVGIKNLPEEELIKLGFRDVIEPTLLDNQYKTSLYYDNSMDKFKYNVIDKSEEEILEESKQAIKNRYQENKDNGWEAYQDFRAKIVIEIGNEVLTEEQAFMIEAVLSVAYDKIANAGDWKTALYLLSTTTVPYDFIQPYYDEAMAEISEYVELNY